MGTGWESMGGSAGYQLPRIHYVINEVYAKAKKLLEDGNEVNLNPYLIMGTYAISYMTAKAAVETTVAKLKVEGKDYQIQYVRGRGYIITKPNSTDENLQNETMEALASPSAKHLFPCTKCTAQFPSEESLMNHMKSYHKE
jgi:hypothetical protein